MPPLPCPGEGIPAGALAGDFGLPCTALPLGGLPGRTLLFLLFLSSPSWRVCAKPSWAGPGLGADRRSALLFPGKEALWEAPPEQWSGEGRPHSTPSSLAPSLALRRALGPSPPPLQPVCLETPWLVPPSGPSEERK